MMRGRVGTGARARFSLPCGGPPASRRAAPALPTGRREGGIDKGFGGSNWRPACPSALAEAGRDGDGRAGGPTSSPSPSFTPAPATPAAAWATFTAHPTPRVVATLLALGCVARLSPGLPPLSLADAAAAALAAAGWVAAEPGLHALLHTGDWYGARVHAEHHAAPYHHISIDSPALVLGWIAAVTALTAGAVSFCGAPPGPALSALLFYCAAGLAYEGVHFTAHCPYRPKTRWGRALKAHHTRHHLHSEAHWLAFQAPFLDGIVGRGPGSVKGVEKGPMAMAAAAAARERRAGV